LNNDGAGWLIGLKTPSSIKTSAVNRPQTAPVGSRQHRAIENRDDRGYYSNIKPLSPISSQVRNQKNGKFISCRFLSIMDGCRKQEQLLVKATNKIVPKAA
jgi:hypothetical protein